MANRIHPIYMALDSHQYAKAVKLASALPTDNVLGQALLAYAQYKSSLSPQALATIQGLLNWNQSCLRDVGEQDIVKSLEQEPERIEWMATDNLIPSTMCSIDFADEAILETIAITLQGLHKLEMVYQLYAWVGSFHPSIRLFSLSKQYSAGLQLLVRSTTNDSILASMQALALQMARQSPAYTAWVARTALWQWQFCSSTADPADLRYQMLPRLAESLSKKMLQQAETCTIEDCFLIIEIYKSQEKWMELLETLPTLVKLTTVQNLDFQAFCWTALEEWEKAEGVYRLLLEKQPGQWSYWKALIQCSIQHGGLEHATTAASEYAARLQGKRPSRSIALVSCELALVSLSEDTASCVQLLTAIQKYADIFSSQVSCVFSDLELYVDAFLRVASVEQVHDLVIWADHLRDESVQRVGGDDRYKLRRLIFALQILQKARGAMPSWTDIAQQWKSFPITEGVQKENQPSDELMLLAVDELLKHRQPLAQDYLAAATLLEMGLHQSPYSHNLKLRLIGVYHLLHASDCSWMRYCDLGMKHIQFDTCSFFILPILLEGGLYQEALSLANGTLKFHLSTVSDSSDVVARALENGIWSKADEFLCFQRNRMNRSLSLLESKGIIMDCAPLMATEVGLAHGIVGGADDAYRATRMIEEARNWFGAPSIISLKNEELELLSDNRDLSILPLGIIPATKAEVIQASLRRKVYHGILIRAAMILEVTKAPKKGKLSKAPKVLLLRCESLRKLLDEDKERPVCQWERAIKVLASLIVIVSSGLLSSDGVADSLKSREDEAIKLLIASQSCIPEPSLDLSPNDVGKVVVDHLVTVMAITKMTAELFLRFGWGRRKKRDSVKALAQFASSFKTCIIQMMAVVKSLDNDELIPPQHDVLDDTILQNVCMQVQSSRKHTYARLMSKLTAFRDDLCDFELEE